MPKILMIAGCALAAWIMLGVIVVLVMAAFSYPAQAAEVRYTVTFSPGGIIADFRATARELRRDRTPIIVDGECDSACTILVDDDAEQACVTPNANLGFHQTFAAGFLTDTATVQRGGWRFRTPGLNEWIKARGGLPTVGVLRMRYEDARRFWRACPELAHP